MAALKARVTVRLERGDGAARVFWEITRVKATITTRFGRHLSAGRKVVKEHETPAAAAKAFDRAIEEKRREGYLDRDELVPQDVLAKAAAARKLARLDLEMPLGDEGAKKLLALASELRAIGAIHVPAESVSPALRASLSGALPRLSWTASPEEEELELEEIDESPAPWAQRASEPAPAPPPLSSRPEPR